MHSFQRIASRCLGCRSYFLTLFAGMLCALPTLVLSFTALTISPLQRRYGFYQLQDQSIYLSHRTRQWRTRHFNFFKNLIDQAFENDATLSKSDKREGMLVGPGDSSDDDENFFVASSLKNIKQTRTDQLTDTQVAWKQRQQALNQVIYDDIVNKEFSFDFYLTGVPNKDPSNDLYGSKTNISSRDRSIGLTVPVDPTVSDVTIAFLSENKCQVVGSDKTGFTIDSANDESNQYRIGDWKLSDDGSQIRFRFGVNGYQRIIETKGTIQKVFWSKDDEMTTQTSTIYTIPTGWLYAECSLSKRPTTAVNINRIEWDQNSAILKIEQTSGLLGVSTKMIPCGKFAAKKTSL
jgi:hypothetical protein